MARRIWHRAAVLALVVAAMAAAANVGAGEAPPADETEAPAEGEAAGNATAEAAAEDAETPPGVPSQALSSEEQAQLAQVEAALLAEIGHPYAVEPHHCQAIEVPTTGCPRVRLLVYSNLNRENPGRVHELGVAYSRLERMRVGRLGQPQDECREPEPELALQDNLCVARAAVGGLADRN